MCVEFGEVTVIIGLVINFLAFRLTIVRISWHLNILDLDIFGWDFFKILYFRAYLDITKALWKKKKNMDCSIDLAVQHI